ncbi:MgtC/SapB family protein [Pleurocapsa sp. PCC 7319]|uniref:MgtC/SapB family protein n=1 Tax=Pleurocapsa sp. PCC 7319 TaxID=118161 RepID=UPI00034BD163|nr:MgtC/SapB family protein [Pleurocapsa sp. PCC 7319]
MTITWTTFSIRLLVGFLLGMGIGIERQWLKTRAVLKTNVLVTLGAAIFVMLSIMTPGDASPTRISAQIVSGVGFLGGGVILREGASVRGINTAATLWCAAAIGTLVGSGYLVHAYLSTIAVVGANLLLRPLVEAFKQQTDAQVNRWPQNKTWQSEKNSKSSSVTAQKSNSPQIYDLTVPGVQLAPVGNSNQYSCHLICFREVETKVLTLMVKFARERNLIVVGMQSRNINHGVRSGEIRVEINANFESQDIQVKLEDLEEIVSLLKAEAKVTSIAWQLLSVNT